MQARLANVCPSGSTASLFFICFKTFANIEKSITASGHISSSTGTSNILNFNSGSLAYLTTTGDISSSA